MRMLHPGGSDGAETVAAFDAAAADGTVVDAVAVTDAADAVRTAGGGTDPTVEEAA